MLGHHMTCNLKFSSCEVHSRPKVTRLLFKWICKCPNAKYSHMIIVFCKCRNIILDETFLDWYMILQIKCFEYLNLEITFR